MSKNSAFESLDKLVLKEYTKLSKNTKETKLYAITTLLNIASWEGVGFFWYHLGLDLVTSGLINAGLSSVDFLYNLQALAGDTKEYNSAGELVKNPLIEYKKKYNRAVRLPLFITGVALTGLGIYNAITGQSSLDNLWPGLSYLSLASSMYLKDRDPKLLQKHRVKDKIYSFVHNYFSLKPQTSKTI